MKLLIIEGEGKRETILKYLKKIDGDFNVVATKGHVRDLPVRTLAIDVNNDFEPKYVIMEDKKDVVKFLKSRADAAKEVYLATDPDREGEAISWHVANILEIPEDKKCRIVFNEISYKAVAAALKEPREIDRSLVDAQQARRVLDRLVGYKLSPVLCKKIQSNLSGGRVQSVALRLVVDREREILNFKPEEYWVLTAFLNKSGASFRAVLSQHLNKKIKISSKAQMDGVLGNLAKADGYFVKSVKKDISRSHAPAPFITSTLQQDALNKLGFSLKQTAQIAQMLYEGVELGEEGKVALVTYIRTDSTRVSPDAQVEAREFITQKFGAKYIPEKPNFYKTQKSAQDAHEAIRPITVLRTPDSIKHISNKNVYRLYKLIYDRFLASQMSEAEFNTVAVEIAAADYIFKATGRTPLFDGFLAAYSQTAEENTTIKASDEEEGDAEAQLPEMSAGDRLSLEKLDPKQKFTKPPIRYTEASLVKALEEKSIGRPATYTPTITTLASRQYTEKDGKYVKPTELGFSVTDMLMRYFPDIMDVRFTAEMEERLDEIEDGGKVWQKVVESFYTPFEEKVKLALGDDYSVKEPPELTDVVCEKCGGAMVIRKGKYGKFMSCSNFPKCKNLINLPKEPVHDAVTASEKAKIPDEPSDTPCPKCGGAMVIKTGKYGKFLACTNYPKCKTTVRMDEKSENESYGNCPLCAKPLARKKSRFGSYFYGCPGYPDCKFLSNDIVLNEKCPDCGAYLVFKKLKSGIYHRCSNRDCRFETKQAEI